MLRTLWSHLSKRRKKQFGLLLMLMVSSSLLEVISVGAVLPFLGVLTTPDQVYQHQLMQPVVQILGLTSPSHLVLPITIFFIVAILLAGVVRIMLLYTMTRLSFATGSDLSVDIYRRTLYQEYSVHVSRNSSEIINGIMTKTNTVIGGVILPTLNLIGSAFLLVGIMSAILLINISVALSAFLSLGLFYWLVIRYTKSHLRDNSKTIANQSTQMIKSLQEGLGGIQENQQLQGQTLCIENPNPGLQCAF